MQIITVFLRIDTIVILVNLLVWINNIVIMVAASSLSKSNNITQNICEAIM